MILHDVSLYGRKGYYRLWLHQEKIAAITDTTASLPSGAKGPHIYLDGALVLPGFINSHDHLDFNLFPQLGRGHYKNYREWGPGIQREHAGIIDKIKSIPPQLRVAWGKYRNILNGFTTVVNHGARLDTGKGPGNVYQQARSLHSPAFEKNWRWKLNHPFRPGKTVAIHAGEGTDEIAHDEIDTLIRWNLLKRNIVAVHGVAMTATQAKKIKGFVWCPASNVFLLGKTAPVLELLPHSNIVFGTDSTLTAPWNAWSHFRQALEHVSAEQLVSMLTVNPASLWQMNDRGIIDTGKRADLLVVPENESIFQNDPGDVLAVISGGRVVMADHQLGEVKNSIEEASEIGVGNNIKFVSGDLPGIMNSIGKYFPFENPLVNA